LEFFDTAQPVVAVFHFTGRVPQFLVTGFGIEIGLFGRSGLANAIPQESDSDADQQDKSDAGSFFMHTQNRMSVVRGYIAVVKKTFRYSSVFFYNHLYRNSLFRNTIMKSGIKMGS